MENETQTHTIIARMPMAANCIPGYDGRELELLVPFTFAAARPCCSDGRSTAKTDACLISIIDDPDLRQSLVQSINDTFAACSDVMPRDWVGNVD
ncbi:hypothetical protein ml_296 [Mollivirus sibericum]|uniref:hypothetical protein n=1 Tax=Mollivirus sibericum TaxID=1678078 RepID=UPI0006B2E97F|nr:hypothetical protein ml_296 [Mollivirus sibericum]ALD62098.1 hypothetical protein ml_296 [Mollivirus sibericum]